MIIKDENLSLNLTFGSQTLISNKNLIDINQLH